MSSSTVATSRVARVAPRRPASRPRAPPRRAAATPRARHSDASSSRSATVAAVALAAWLASSSPALAAGDPAPDPASSPLVQELLRRTEENREARAKERLDDYNRRNFADYFDVVDKGYSGREVSENDRLIRAQLEKWRGGEK